MCGKYPAQVTNAVGRGALVQTDDGYIDDSDERNLKTLVKWKAAFKAKGGKTKSSADEKPKKGKKDVPDPVEKSESDTWSDRKLIAEVKYKENQALNWELRNAILKGENIPVSMVEGLIKMLAHSFQTQFKNAALNLLTEISHKTKMGENDFAKFKEKLYNSINKSHRSALNESKRGIKSVVAGVKEKSDDDENQ